ncbi:MAG: TonB-dependent receptor [Deltaproteobacteria bacterium]|nr:TonB-dependent receptor [Deltaproteobacteria bacterium]
MSAKFENKETRVPLVPETKASFGLEWRIIEPFLIGLTGSWVGSRFDGNDENNDRYEKLESYKVVDGKLSYRYKGLTLFGGVNNIFNEIYSTVAYSETYYPMPTRNFYGGIEWRF